MCRQRHMAAADADALRGLAPANHCPRSRQPSPGGWLWTAGSCMSRTSLADPEYALPEAAAAGRTHHRLGCRCCATSEPIGVIALNRQRVEPFTERQIELVRTFADQAVIAMENARLLGELQARTRDLEESLEYQTATSDVLKVISRSTADVQPVLDTVVETAARLCGADVANITIPRGRGLLAMWRVRLAPRTPSIGRSSASEPSDPGRGSLAGARVALEGRVVHDRGRLRRPGLCVYREAAIAARWYAPALGVPLLREGEP